MSYLLFPYICQGSPLHLQLPVAKPAKIQIKAQMYFNTFAYKLRNSKEREKPGNNESRISKRDVRSCQVNLKTSCEKNDSWITNTTSGGVGVASLAFSESREFSNIAREVRARLCPGVYAIWKEKVCHCSNKPNNQIISKLILHYQASISYNDGKVQVKEKASEKLEKLKPALTTLNEVKRLAKTLVKKDKVNNPLVSHQRKLWHAELRFKNSDGSEFRNRGPSSLQRKSCPLS